MNTGIAPWHLLHEEVHAYTDAGMNAGERPTPLDATKGMGPLYRKTQTPTIPDFGNGSTKPSSLQKHGETFFDIRYLKIGKKEILGGTLAH